MPEPWYHAGLRFSCTQCGHCCTGEPGFVWVDDADLAVLVRQRARGGREEQEEGVLNVMDALTE